MLAVNQSRPSPRRSPFVIADPRQHPVADGRQNNTLTVSFRAFDLQYWESKLERDFRSVRSTLDAVEKERDAEQIDQTLTEVENMLAFIRTTFVNYKEGIEIIDEPSRKQRYEYHLAQRGNIMDALVAETNELRERVPRNEIRFSRRSEERTPVTGGVCCLSQNIASVGVSAEVSSSSSENGDTLSSSSSNKERKKAVLKPMKKAKKMARLLARK